MSKDGKPNNIRTQYNIYDIYRYTCNIEDKCYISLQQDKTYNQKDVLYFLLMFVNKPKYRTVVCTNKNTYLLLKIILSNQVEVNTGPSANTSSDSIKYPCYICNIPVLWSDKWVACDKCDQWYHAKCINMSSQVYHGLDMSTNWYCNKCETPNDISALY